MKDAIPDFREPTALECLWAEISLWFEREWWGYLLSPRAENDIPWLTVLRCRIAGHPCGVVYYNPGGYEPDYSCKDCGDDLG